MRLLLAHPDVDANILEKGGRSALFVACGLGFTTCVELLLSWSGGWVDVNQKDKEGVTPIWAAANQGYDVRAEDCAEDCAEDWGRDTLPSHPPPCIQYALGAGAVVHILSVPPILSQASLALPFSLFPRVNYFICFVLIHFLKWNFLLTCAITMPHVHQRP